MSRLLPVTSLVLALLLEGCGPASPVEKKDEDPKEIPSDPKKPDDPGKDFPLPVEAKPEVAVAFPVGRNMTWLFSEHGALTSLEIAGGLGRSAVDYNQYYPSALKDVSGSIKVASFLQKDSASALNFLSLKDAAFESSTIVSEPPNAFPSLLEGPTGTFQVVWGRSAGTQEGLYISTQTADGWSAREKLPFKPLALTSPVTSDASGNVHILGLDDSDAEIYANNVSGTWETHQTAALFPGRSTSSKAKSLWRAASGEVYLGFTNSIKDSLTVFKGKGSTWTEVGTLSYDDIPPKDFFRILEIENEPVVGWFTKSSFAFGRRAGGSIEFGVTVVSVCEDGEEVQAAEIAIGADGTLVGLAAVMNAEKVIILVYLQVDADGGSKIARVPETSPELKDVRLSSSTSRVWIFPQ